MLDPTRLKLAEAIFHDVVDLPPHERERLWSTRCNGDEELRGFVERLLTHHDSGMAGFLDGPAAVAASLAQRDQAGSRVGGFHLLRRIGEGGMGVVYEATQANPRRRVALKILRGGRFIDEHSLRLFRREIEALARVRHACVAAIHEAGVTEDGQHYFAMDFVEGRSLTDHVAAANLNLRRRLELFRSVCDAIHHAHQRGVMHRDLKPSNILVDEGGCPRVLDFGLARIIDGEAAGPGPHTATGRVQGTMPYMSPEQARGDADQIDIRTDVYSLGVILYELVSGRLPYDATGVPLPDAVRIVCTEPPARLWAFGAGGAARGAPIKADLETIVLKALEKEPQRRYDSAAALSADILRFLTDQPIVARPVSTAYQLRKLVARHRWPSAFAGVVLLLIVAFGVAMGVLYRRQYREWQRAEKAESVALAAGTDLRAERDEARRARDEEAEQRRLAEQESSRSAALTDFLIVTLGLADPDAAQTLDAPMQELLARTSAEAGRWFEDQPESEARVRTVIGRAHAAMGDLDQARTNMARALELHERVLGTGPEALYDVLWSYVHVLEDTSDIDWRNRWRQLTFLPGTILSRSVPELGATVVEFRRQAMHRHDPEGAEPTRAALVQHAAGTSSAGEALMLADILRLAGNDLVMGDHFAAGRSYLEDALVIQRRFLAESNVRVVGTLGDLVRHLIADGRSSEAEGHIRHALHLLEGALAPEHWYLAVQRGRLGACLIAQDRLAEAEGMLLASLAEMERARGFTNRYAREMCEYLIRLYEVRGEESEAARWRRSLAARIAGSDQQFLLAAHMRLIFAGEYAPVLEAHAEAVAMSTRDRDGVAIRKTIDARRRLIPDEHPASHIVAEWLQRTADAFANRYGFSDLTMEMLQESVRIGHAADHLHPWKRACALFWLAFNLEAAGHFSEGEAVAREASTLAEAHFGHRDDLLSNVRSVLGSCIARQGRHAEAEPLLVESYRRLLAAQGASGGNTINAIDRLVRLYLDWERPQEAVPHLLAYSSSRPVTESMATAVLERLRPGLGVALERLRTAPRHDRRALAARIDDALAARAELGPRDPIAILFHDLCYRLSVEGSTRDPVWTPLVRDMLQTQRRIDAGRKLSLYVGALTTLELERGDFAAALPLAQEGLQIAPSGRVYQRSRQSMLGAALAGLGRYEEAEALLRAGWPPESLPALTSTKCFGYMIDLYGASGRPEAALEFAGPVMHDALAKGSATFRDTLAWKVVRRPNLGAPLYALALDLARAASGADAGDADRLRALGAALLRAGEPQEAVAALTRADGMDGDGERLGTPLLAMALWGVGDEAAAREALAESRRLVEDLGDWCSQEIWSLVAEAEAMIE